MKLRIIVIILILLSVYCDKSISQEKWWKGRKYKSEEQKQKYQKCKSVFNDIESGFKYNNINYIKQYFENQIYLDIVSSEKGYYSDNQATQILSEFMDYFTVYSYSYNNSVLGNSYALAYGVYTYKQGSTLINIISTISLTYTDSQWLIDRIALN